MITRRTILQAAPAAAIVAVIPSLAASADEIWMDRFAARMVAVKARFCTDRDGETLADLWDFARNQAAPGCLHDGMEYDSPEDAADIDMSYWEL